MKYTLSIFLLLTFFFTKAQESNIYTKKGFAIKGYDVVAYFDNKAVEGNKDTFTYKYEGISYAFSNFENLSKFKTAPTKYLPQYGGHCSYAMATLGKKVSPNPTVFEIRDDKLYLFHRAKGLQNWLAENPEKLKKQADINWKKITNKK